MTQYLRNTTLVWLMLGMMVWVTVAQDHESGITTNVTPIFGNLARPGAPVALAVDVENPTARFTGRLETWVGSRGNAFVLTRHIAIGEGQFRFHLYPPVRDQYQKDVHVRLLTAQKQAVHDSKRRLNQRANVYFRMAAVPGLKTQLKINVTDKLTQTEAREGGTDSTSHALIANVEEIGDLPDRWYGYRSLNALLWNCSQASGLSSAGQEALLGWVRSGGRLVLANDSGDTQFNSPLPAQYPNAVLGTRREHLGEPLEGNYFISDSFAAKANQLFVVQAEGFGQVVFIRSGLADLARWPESDVRALFGAKERDAQPAAEASPDAEISSMLGMGALRSRPQESDLNARLDRGLISCLARTAGYNDFSFTPVLLIGLFYLLIVSVVDYVFLRQVRRQTWTWFTYPSYILMFSFFTYFSFYKGKLMEAGQHRFQLTDYAAHSSAARHTSLTCIRGKNQNTIEFRGEHSDNLLPLALNAPAKTNAKSSAAAKIIESRKGKSVHLRGGDDVVRFASNEWVETTSEQPFKADLVSRDGEPQGEISRNIGMRIDAAFLYHNGWFYELSKRLTIKRRLWNLANRIEFDEIMGHVVDGTVSNSPRDEQLTNAYANYLMANTAACILSTDRDDMLDHLALRNDLTKTDANHAIIMVMSRRDNRFRTSLNSSEITCVRQVVPVRQL